MIGQALVELLYDTTSANIMVADLPNVDLRDRKDCKAVCEGQDIVFHLAGIKGSPQRCMEAPASFSVPMIQFNANMIEAAYNADVEWFLYTSSVGVYHPTEVFVEDDVWKTFPSVHDWYAGWTKRIGELQAQAYQIQYGWNEISIVRPTNTYGPYDDFDSDGATAVPSLIRKFLSGKSSVVIWGDGSNVRDFMYSEDVARGMMLVMKKSPGPEYPVNLGSGKRHSIKDLVNIILDKVDKKPEIVWDTSKITGDNIRVMNIDRAKSLGFKQTISLEEGVRQTINWYRDER